MSNVFRPVANQNEKYFVEYLYHYALKQLQLVGGYSASCQIKNKIHITKTSDPKTEQLIILNFDHIYTKIHRCICITMTENRENV